MNNIIEAYNTLANDRSLPKMESGDLVIKSSIKKLSELKDVVASYASGWAMYSDNVFIIPDGSELETAVSSSNLLEAEFIDANDINSLHIRNLNGDEYAVTEYLPKLENCDNEQYGYVDIEVFTRHDLANKSNLGIVKYRLWYKCMDIGDFDGRWEPTAQQFMGFDKED